jgi:hypothetical protein
MKLVKRWAIVGLIHATHSILLLGLEWWFPFPEIQSPIGLLSSANPLIGLGAVIVIYGLIGLVWGLLVTKDDRFNGVVLGYIVLLGGMLVTVWLLPWGWMGYLSLNEPLGYFTRNMTSRTLIDQIVLGLGTLSAPLGLWIGLRSGYRLSQQKRQSED